MPALSDKIDQDLKSAMLEKNPVRVSALRLLKAAVMNAQIQLKKERLDDGETLALIQKEIKQGRESIGEYEKGRRPDLVAKEKAQIAVWEHYLPPQMDEASLETELRRLLQENGLQTKRDFGKAMKIAQGALKGRADNARISAVLNRLFP